MINYIRTIFSEDIRAIIPQISMSAGTIIALSCSNIIMGKQSSLGPIDPQLGGIACQSVLEEFDTAVKEVTNNPASAALWQVIFNKYTPTFITACKKSIEWSEKLMEQYKDLLFADAKGMDSKRDNANINTDSPMGIMLKLGTEGAKCYADHFAIPDEYAKADRENYVHIHDKDFSMITANCCQIDILKLFKGGFSTGHGYLREPNSIRSAASLACIAIQSNQNDMFKPLG